VAIPGDLPAQHRASRRATLALALALSGCMTIIDATVDDPLRLGIYGGTRTFFFDDTGASHTSACLIGFFLFPIDLPLSLVADTLFLPITIPYTLTHGPLPLTPVEAAGERVREGVASVDDLLLVAPSQEPVPDLRELAIRGLAAHPEAAARSVPVLSEVVRKGGQWTPWTPRVEAAMALDQLDATEELDAALPQLLYEAPETIATDGRLVATLARHRAGLLDVLRAGGWPALSAARVFGALAPVDEEVARALVAALDDADQYGWERRLADAAQEALEKTVTPATTRLLLERGVGGRIRVRMRIVTIIASRPTLSAEEEEFLLDALDHGPPAVRDVAAVHVDRLPPARRLPALMRALEEGQGAALDGLAALGTDAAPALEAIVRCLGDRRFSHDAACRALGAIGPAARSAVPDLIASLDSPRVSMAPALEALGRIGGPGAARFIVGRLREHDAALDALVSADPGCARTWADLVTLVLDRAAFWEARLRAVRVLDRAGANRPEVLAALAQVAHERPEGWRQELCWEAKEAHDRLARR
jgi:uncharacterized protein YceK